MGQRLGMRAMQGCAAAACAIAALGALAQGAPAVQAAIERAQSTGVMAGLQRALGTPLEVVWLRTAAEIEAWASDGLAGATVGRTGWRYIFGGNAQFAPAPNELARLVVSSLRLPKAPISTGTLDLSGSGRLFIVSPEAPDRAAPAQVALVLAPGSTLQVSDTASPGLQIEIKAPERGPLLLGNLASASVRRMLAFLVKPGALSASEVRLRNGRVALHTGGEIELAAIVDGRTAPPAPAVAVATAPQPVAAAAPIELAVVEKTVIPKPAIVEALVATVEEGKADTPLEPPAASIIESPVAVAAVEEPVPEPVAQKTVAVEVAAIEAEPAAHLEPIAVKPEPVAVAAIPAKPVIAIIEASPPPAKTPQQAADIARMRAEIESEIARDRERLAHQRAPVAPAPKRFVFGV